MFISIIAFALGNPVQKITERIKCNQINATHTKCTIPNNVLKTIKTSEFELANVHMSTYELKLGSLYRKKERENIFSGQQHSKLPVVVDITQICVIKEEKIICHNRRRKNHKDVPGHK